MLRRMVASKGQCQRWQDQHSSSSCCCNQQRVPAAAAVVAVVLLALLPSAAAQPLPASRASLKATRSTWTAAAALKQAAAAPPLPSLPPPMPADGKVGLEADIVREMSSIVLNDAHEALEWFEYPPLRNSNGDTNLMVRTGRPRLAPPVQATELPNKRFCAHGCSLCTWTLATRGRSGGCTRTSII